MTENEMVLLMARGAITQLSPEDQAKIKAFQGQIQDIVDSDQLAGIALVLVAAEFAASK